MVRRQPKTKRTAISEEKAITFDLASDNHEGYIFRVKIDHEGVSFWRRATGNLDEPRQMDKLIRVTWEKVALAGYAFYGRRGVTGKEPKGPANSLNGLRYLIRKAR